MFLGLSGIAVKSHGSTDAFGFANAIGVAVDMKVNGFLDKIRAELARLSDGAACAGAGRCKPLAMNLRSAGRRLRRLSARADRHQRRARRAGSTPPTNGSASAPASASAASPPTGELTSDLAVAAARRALAGAGMSGSDLDLIVLATATPDKTFPATATKVQAQLGMKRRRRLRRAGGVRGLHLCAVGRRQRASGSARRAPRW